MAKWSSGYVADLAYTLGFYREMTPALLRFVALCKGVRVPSLDAKISYCELGCGLGLTANVIAAANPEVDVYATDFNPAHVVFARDLASQSGLTNVRFYDDSFVDFLNRSDLPEFDFITLHGIYSWINPESRAAIRDFISKKLKPGGLVYVSYNCAPGWAPAVPLRALMYMHAQQQDGPTALRVAPALAFASEIVQLDAGYFKSNPNLVARLDRLKLMDRSYVAHEYFNDSWFLPFFSDVSDYLSEAKLSFVGSAQLLDHVDAIHMTPGQSAFVRSLPSPVFSETVRDFMVNQQFRRDVYVKGFVGENVFASREAWAKQHFILTVPRPTMKMAVNGALGEASLQKDIYDPILDCLEAGLVSFGDIHQACEARGIDWNHLIQAIVVLVGAGYAHPCTTPGDTVAAAMSAKRFNEHLVRASRLHGDVTVFASPVLGSGVTVGRLEQLYLLAMTEGKERPTQWGEFAMEILQSQGQKLKKDGKTLDNAEEIQAEIVSRAVAFADMGLPLLQKLGAI